MWGTATGVEGAGARIRERCCWLQPADSEGQPGEGWGGRRGWGRSALGEELGEEGRGDGLPRRTATAFPAPQHEPAARGPERKCRPDRAPAALGPDRMVPGLLPFLSLSLSPLPLLSLSLSVSVLFFLSQTLTHPLPPCPRSLSLFFERGDTFLSQASLHFPPYLPPSLPLFFSFLLSRLSSLPSSLLFSLGVLPSRQSSLQTLAL